MAGEKSKIYIEVVNHIRKMMETDGLEAGDKIPSERELSERLNVGRSSVREALRAIELLGIIETRRGEGTFIREVGEHQLIELLATFLLQDSKAKRDLVETKFWIEQIGLKIAFYRITDSDLYQLKEELMLNHDNYDEFLKMFFQYIDNRLLFRIWQIVDKYAQTFKHMYPLHSKEKLTRLYEAILERNEQEALRVHAQLYEKLMAAEIVD